MGYTCRAKLADAFHEAGHACMSLVLGRPIEPVSVIFHSQRVFFEDGPWLPAQCSSSIEQIEAEIMVGLAGPLAEAHAIREGHAVATPAHEARWELSLNDAIRQWLARGSFPIYARDEYLDELQDRTLKALTHRGCWEGVAAVAWALVYRVRLAPAEVERHFWCAVAARQRALLETLQMATSEESPSEKRPDIDKQTSGKPQAGVEPQIA
jgi:hypothetical protein